MFKRIGLFLLTNILVVATISIVLNILGVHGYITAHGIDYSSLLIFCFVWGMGGAFISLALSAVMAKWTLGVQVIDPQNPGQFSWLLELVSQLSRAAGLPKIPEVGIYQSPDPNGFATGPTQRRALVALSTGLLQSMNRDELAGVIGHELTHVKNGDMVTMTLLQGVVNAFGMFLARAISFAISQGSRDEDNRGMNWLLVWVLDIVFSILGSLVVCWFSRQREYRADAGSAKIAGRERMIAALEALKRTYGQVQEVPQRSALATLKISGHTGGWAAAFATHPDLDDRIARLRSFTA